MKTKFFFFAAAAAALLSFTACQKEVEGNTDSALTHKVSFIAEPAQSKTSAVTEDGKVKFSWTKNDENQFMAYEIIGGEYKAATEVIGNLNGDGTMSIIAEFAGAPVEGSKYQAVLNGTVRIDQSDYADTNHDITSDLLVSEIVDASSASDGIMTLRFERRSALVRVNLEGLGADYMDHVVVETLDGQKLCGVYNCTTDSFEDLDSRVFVSAPCEAANASATFWTLPVENTSLRITATTCDYYGNFIAAYQKDFAEGASISFPAGDKTTFTVQMEPKKQEVFDLTVVGDMQASAQHLIWYRALHTIMTDKGSSNQNADNYCPASSTPRSSTRVYSGQILQIIPTLDVEVSSIVFETTSASYASALANSTWTNAVASASGTTVTVTPDYESELLVVKSITANITETVGISSIVVNYGKPETVAVSGITLDQTSAEIVKGESLILTASIQPEDATQKGVTWTSDNEDVATVADGTVKGVAEGTATITATTVDGGFTATCTVTVTAPKEVFTTIAQIKNALASGTNSGPVAFAAELEGAVVTYVNGINAFIEDESAGILYYGSGHGLTAGDVLSGKVEGAGYNFKGTVEITSFTTKPTITSGETPAPKVVTLAELIDNYDAYTSRLVKIEGVTLGDALSSSSRNSTVSQGSNSLDVRLQNTSVSFDGGIYGDLTCIPAYYNTTKQLNIWAKEHFEIAQIAVTGISLDQTTLSVEAGRSAVLTATINPVNAANKSITWTSDNEAVATVTDGTVKGVAKGIATITATTVDGGFTATCTVTVTPSQGGEPEKTETTIDFESDASTYSFWTFENMTSKQTGDITAKAGTYYGTTGGKTTASITTTSAVVSPKFITFYVSKQTNNKTDSSWKLQVSSDNKKTWTDVKTTSATSMSKGTWVEITEDLSAYSNVYVRVHYTGSTAVRNIDELTFSYLD